MKAIGWWTGWPGHVLWIDQWWNVRKELFSFPNGHRKYLGYTRCSVTPICVFIFIMELVTHVPATELPPCGHSSAKEWLSNHGCRGCIMLYPSSPSVLELCYHYELLLPCQEGMSYFTTTILAYYSYGYYGSISVLTTIHIVNPCQQPYQLILTQYEKKNSFTPKPGPSRIDPVSSQGPSPFLVEARGFHVNIHFA